VDGATVPLGFAPAVRMSGRLDAAPADAGEHLVGALREAPSKPGRNSSCWSGTTAPGSRRPGAAAGWPTWPTARPCSAEPCARSPPKAAGPSSSGGCRCRAPSRPGVGSPWREAAYAVYLVAERDTAGDLQRCGDQAADHRELVRNARSRTHCRRTARPAMRADRRTRA
jgi:hypothetical protein